MKNFLLKQMLKSQMKDIPQEQQDKMLEMIEKNPELFSKIAQEIKEAVDSGKDQMAATLKVVEKYKGELEGLK